MRIAMIGSGYVGLVSGACLSEFGHTVICVDKAEDKIAALKQGQIPIFEPGLDEIVAANVKGGRLAFGTDLGEAVRDADAVFIGVGTPSRRPCRPDLCLRRGRRDRARPDRLYRCGHQIHGARGHQPPGGSHHPQGQSRRRFRHGIEPRIPAGGLGDRGFPPPRPGGCGLRHRAGARGDARGLPPALPERNTHRLHHPRKFGTDQICGQCLPGHQDHLHQ